VTWFQLISFSSVDVAMTCLFAEARSLALAVVMPDYLVCRITGFLTAGTSVFKHCTVMLHKSMYQDSHISPV
jgi:hypothetical protein